IAFIALTGLLTFGFLGTVFFSSTLVVAAVLVILGVFFTFNRPTWTLFAFAAYLPFEPFLLKFVPDDVYVYARYGSELLVYLLLAVVFWRMATGSIKFHRTPIDIAFVLVVLLALSSAVINTMNPVFALLGLRQIFRFVLLFFITTYLSPSKILVKNLIITMLAIVAFQGILGYSQRLIGEPLDTFLLPSASRTLGNIELTSGTVQNWDPGERVFGTMGRYDQLGIFIAFFLILLVAWLYEVGVGRSGDYSLERSLRLSDRQSTALSERSSNAQFAQVVIHDRSSGNPRSLNSLAPWILLFFSLPVLGLSYSRSAWFGFVLAFLFIAIYIKRDKRVILVTAIAPFLVAAYLSITGLVVNQLIDSRGNSFSDRIFEAFSYTRWVGEYYGLGRVYWIVQTVIKVVPSAPVFGHGPGTYGGGAVAALGNTEVYDNLGIPFGVYGTEGYIDN
ncbi:MAG: O-antigen ligase family protein, partial [Methylococcaceae bacterium]